ncbi:hypothetical protein JXE04_01320 [Patescibacteria group bacterium]|nr:hypothetical protein [Patescibacteria group bacterium]
MITSIANKKSKKKTNNERICLTCGSVYDAQKYVGCQNKHLHVRHRLFSESRQNDC